MGTVIGIYVCNTSKILDCLVWRGDRKDFTEEIPLELRPVSVSSPGRQN